MPELPEVETIAQGLNDLLVGERINRVRVNCLSSLRQAEDKFCSNLQNRQIIQVRRRGKLLFIDLDRDEHLIFHLKMTGKVLFFYRDNFTVDKHTRLIFTLSSGNRLAFHDIRKFGYCRLLDSQGLKKWSYYSTLGLEPLKMNQEEFKGAISKRKGRIKSLLLDQRVIAGIGNIYADESLYLAGIHPECPGSCLEETEFKALYKAVREVLKKALLAKGTSFRDYVDGLGNPGSYQNNFLVYGRKGQECKNCGCQLESKKISGRSTVFCPQCQKKN